VIAMTASLRHRGPDDGGIWLDAGAGVALGRRRLSIIDVSAKSVQSTDPEAGARALAPAASRRTATLGDGHPDMSIARSGQSVAWA
jgi:hypothetical protein